jgi:hypothetical protein
MDSDIRFKRDIRHEDILELNFIRKPCRFFFRKHFSEGLRSRLMQVLDPEDVAAETRGVVRNGIRWFRLARPRMMLRIFKTPFRNLQEAHKETRFFKTLQRYLPVRHYAVSQEFVAHYRAPGGDEILLCGLQEYVDGRVLDPWRENGLELPETQLSRSGAEPGHPRVKPEAIRHNAASFVANVKNMIRKAGVIPDLAGVGNIRVTAAGDIKLIDINNISRLCFDSRIRLDEKGYPVGDKSIEALYRIERYLSRKADAADEYIYRLFLTGERMARVRDLEKQFQQTEPAAGNYPRLGP